MRIADSSGVSGLGEVAEGVEFTSGKAVLSWITKLRSVAIYDSMEELVAIHGHEGDTIIEWIDRAQ